MASIFRRQPSDRLNSSLLYDPGASGGVAAAFFETAGGLAERVATLAETGPAQSGAGAASASVSAVVAGTGAGQTGAAIGTAAVVVAVATSGAPQTETASGAAVTSCAISCESPAQADVAAVAVAPLPVAPSIGGGGGRARYRHQRAPVRMPVPAPLRPEPPPPIHAALAGEMPAQHDVGDAVAFRLRPERSTAPRDRDREDFYAARLAPRARL